MILRGCKTASHYRGAIHHLKRKILLGKNNSCNLKYLQYNNRSLYVIYYPSPNTRTVKFVRNDIIQGHSQELSNEERFGQARILGRRIRGSRNALIARVQKNRVLMGHTTLMSLLTVCVECRAMDMDFEGNNMGQIIIERPGSLILGVCLENEVVDIITSEVIIIEGIAMNAIKTVGLTGQWQAWYLLDKPRAIFKNYETG